jgi:vacuolar protein sorting-associated protein 16
MAWQLLDYEPRAADQVPLLMSMQEHEIALVKAIESGDSDLGACRRPRQPARCAAGA